MRISVTCTGPIWFQDLSDHGFKFQGDGAGSLFIYYISCIVWRCYTIFILLNGEMDRAIKIDGTAPKWPSCFEAFAHSTTHPLRRLGFVDPAHRLDPLGILVEILRNDENFKKWKWKPRTPTFTRSMELRRRVSCINKCRWPPEVQSACVYVTKFFRPMFFWPCHFFQV